MRADDGWREALDGLLGPRAATGPAGAGGSAGAAVPLALQVQARELLPRTAHRWNGPTTRAAADDAVGGLRLGVRPVARTEKGWARGALTWQSLPHVRNRLNLDVAQHRWACELGALYRAAVPAAAGQDPDWLFLDEAPNPLVWELLVQGEALGVPLVAPGNGSARLAGEASLALDAVRVAEGFRVAPRLTVDGEPVPVERAHAVGDHGVWAVGASPAHVVLAPFAARVDPALLARDPLVVPEEAAAELRERWLPALQDRFAVVSSDGSVPVAAPRPPLLVLAVRTAEDGGATLTWRWERVHGGPPPARDDVIAALPEGWWPSRGLPAPRALDAEAALDLAADVLPALAALPDVAVERLGAPAPVVVTGEPVIDVTVAPTERNDWFDLGVTVTVDGRDIPFGPLFAAIAGGKRRLPLVDGTFLSLAHPRLRALVDLVEESAEIPEWASGFVVPRPRAAQWTEFEDLADSTEEAVEWRALRDAVSAPPTAVPAPAGLHAVLRPYQQEGLEWLAFLWRHELGGVLADDMGLGKTLQCLALAQHVHETAPEGERRPILIVAPTSVASNWVAEAARFAPGLDVRRVVDADSPKAPIADLVAGADLVVTTYARLRLDATAFTRLARDGAFSALVLDEAQAVKNATARTHAVARDLRIRRTIAVTGTPLENSLTELHAILALSTPGLFPSVRRFREEYVRPIEGQRAGYTEGVGAGNAPEANAAHRAERLARLRARMRPFVLRRTKEQVAPELPPIEEQVLSVDLSPDHRALYDVTLQRERRKLFGLLPDMDRNRFIVLRSLTLLRLLALDAALIDAEHDGVRSSKLDLLADELVEALAEGRRALVFSQFPSYLRLVGARLEEEGVPWTLLEGGTRDRDAVIERFRTGEAAVFLISLKAGGFGLNLTEADLVYLLDPWWNPAAEAQAIDRAHRIGQDKPVTVRRLVAAGTIEEKVLALQQRKQDLFDAVVDDGEPFSAALTADDVRDLLA
ncbi:DEAD/DEAH box helicase [Amnibacterium setariae]|uniref:DEAD/DEAH box helicase n=1 Tax=Amnibacterium setariae TaxID=2306585 RepID=UPI0011C3F6E8|nr:DEAD/DEAH box helicase [Amnibacterium setariae]